MFRNMVLELINGPGYSNNKRAKVLASLVFWLFIFSVFSLASMIN